jgi:hypothetical protein
VQSPAMPRLEKEDKIERDKIMEEKKENKVYIKER